MTTVPGIPVPAAGSGLQSRLAIIGGAMIAALAVVALGAPAVAPYDPYRAVADTFGEPAPPQRAHLMGTDELGRDVCSRVVYGARVSLLVALVATTIAVLIGVTVGSSAGYMGGRIDALLMRLTDVVLAFPALLLAIALAALFEPGLTTLFVVIGMVGWTTVARTVRSEVLSLRTREFVAAAIGLGAGHFRIVTRHILPNVLPTIAIMAALSTSSTVLLDAGLSYLGLGVPVPIPSWGRMISESQMYYRTAPWLMVFPGLAIVYTVTAFNFVGYGLLARFGGKGRAG